MTALQSQHEGELTEDVSDLIFSLFGTAMHTVLERSGVGLQEERLFTDICGWTVSGQFDYLDNDGIIWDWKTASVWEVTNGVKAERESQLNCYAHLASVNGIEVKGLRIGFILRDWSKSKAKTEPGYPPFQVMVYPIPLWQHSDGQAYMEERVKLHQAARTTLPECTPEERWARPDSYAVTKTGNKRASKLFTNRNDADTDALARGSGYTVTMRPGESTRCKFYCSVLPFCAQGQKLV